MVNDLPAPFNVQAVVINKTITLSWQWQSPESLPQLRDFGYEVLKNDGTSFPVPATTFSDFDLSFGTYSYRVRARASAKRNGKKTLLVSDWSEPANAVIQVACRQPPRVTLQVVPTQKSYSEIPALRMHLSGAVQIPEGCSLTHLTYHLETGAGINHSGPLTADKRGRFDEFIDAVRPDDELPTGGADFTVTVTAEDETGPATSNAFTVHMELQNPYAPRN